VFVQKIHPQRNGANMKIGTKKIVEVEAKTLKLHLKVCDSFYASMVDQHGDVLKDYEGYVPDFMPGDHYGDYVYLDIDLDTGKIINWEPPTRAEIEAFVNEGKDGDE
jgi:hypothetical protein